MKLKKVIILFGITILCLCGCNKSTSTSNDSANTSIPEKTQPYKSQTPTKTPTSIPTSTPTKRPTEVPTKKPKDVKDGKSITRDGITVSVENCKIEKYKDNEGKYDRKAVLTYKIKNDTNSDFGYSSVMWGGKTENGTKLETGGSILDMDYMKVLPGEEKKEKTYFLIKKKNTKINKIKVSYAFMDYSKEYWTDLGKIIKGKMGEEEYNKKYGDLKYLDFIISVE